MAGDLIQLRRNTSAAWTLANPVLKAGEPGVETDTFKLKIGNGSTAWASLPYASGGGSGGGSVWYTGSGVPDDGDGVENDLYLDTASGDVYQKGLITWGSAIANITGPPGTNGDDGVGITSITRTSGDGSPGTTDTYTITYSDASTSVFYVYNGADGASNAAGVSIADSGGHFTATDVEGALDELFTSVSNGKVLVATAITDKGGTADGSDTFQELADAITSLPSGSTGEFVTIAFNGVATDDDTASKTLTLPSHPTRTATAVIV